MNNVLHDDEIGVHARPEKIHIGRYTLIKHDKLIRIDNAECTTDTVAPEKD